MGQTNQYLNHHTKVYHNVETGDILDGNGNKIGHEDDFNVESEWVSFLHPFYLSSLAWLIGLALFVVIVMLTSCSSDDNCIGVWEKVESNRQEAQRACVGLANDYPELSVVSDELVSIDCSGYEDEKNVYLTEGNFCGLEVTEKRTLYKKYSK